MAREGAAKDVFSSMSPETVFVPEEERLSHLPDVRPSFVSEGEARRETQHRLEAPIYDEDDDGVQLFTDPKDGAMFFAMVKGQDGKAVRETAAVLRNTCGENHLGATAGRGRLEATRSVMTVASEHGHITNPREDFASLATAGAARYGLELIQAKNELNEMTGQPPLDAATFDGLVYDQRVGPEGFYGVDLDPSNQEGAKVEGEDGADLLRPITKELNLISTVKAADDSPEAQATRNAEQSGRVAKLAEVLSRNAGFRSLNPDARLNFIETVKSKAKTKGIALDDATRESLDSLHEHELDDEASGRVSELFGSITRFGKDLKTGERRKVAMREIRIGMKNSPDLSPIERVTLYDRLLRNGYIEKGSPEAEAILTERRVQVTTTGGARVYAVTPDLRVRDITAESEGAGGSREVPVGSDPTAPAMRKLTSGNFHAEPGTTIVVTRQKMSPEDVSMRFQTQPDNLEGIREELDRDREGQTIIFKVK